MNNHILPFAERDSKIRLFFMDEASFGRINQPSYCWCPAGVRPVVPCHKVREYVYVFGAVDPIEGDDYYIIAPECNTAWTNEFLGALSKEYSNDYLLIITDNASWHKSKTLEVPYNITLFYLPPYTPEMNPIEQIWKEVRKDGFKNTLFDTLDKVKDKLSDSLMGLPKDLIKSVCGRDWIKSMF
jgi:hypothetical protein